MSALGEDVGQRLHQIAGDRGRVVLVAAVGIRADPVARPGRIHGRYRAGVIDDRVHEHADPAAVRRFDHGPQVVHGSQCGIDGRPVASPVAVIAPGLPGALVDAAVDLLHERRHPDRRHAEAVEVPRLDPAEQAGKVTALEAPQHRAIVLATESGIVCGIAVLEAIGEEEVDGGRVPEVAPSRSASPRSPVGGGGGASPGHPARSPMDRRQRGTRRGLHGLTGAGAPSWTRSVSAAASTNETPPMSSA